eukprot:8346099-Lingulodinium_polyedra.AAC.1
MSVLYQTKFGQKKSKQPNPQSPNLHAIITVQRHAGVLVAKPPPNEGSPHLIAALTETSLELTANKCEWYARTAQQGWIVLG